MYRVRKSWKNEKSQKGAFNSLLNAKLCAFENGVGYSVYNDSGKAVYKVKDSDWLRVRSTWADAGSQVGAFKKLGVAKEYADKYGKTVFTWEGEAVYTGKGSPAAPSDPTPAPAPAPTPSGAVDTSVVKTMEYNGKLKKKVGNHNKGATVRVTRNYAKKWVITSDGATFGDRATYIDLTKQIYDNTCRYSDAVAEAWINERGIGSPTGWLFWCNKWGQRVYVFKGSKGKWKLHKTFKCSTGNIKYGDGSDQGVGFAWKIWDKDKVFQGPQAKQYYNQHYTSKWGNSIHQGSGGNPATHGCIGIPKASAIWVFDNLPINTRVVVY